MSYFFTPDANSNRIPGSWEPDAEAHADTALLETIASQLPNRVLSPGQLVSVLGKELPEPPKARPRFLHGGPPLSDLSAASAVLNPTASAAKGATPSAIVWRAFTDEEEERLQAAWEGLGEGQRREAGMEEVGEIGENPVSDPDSELQSHIVPVGLDSLFSVDLKSSILFPDFWAGAPVRVIQATWFYAPPTPYGSKLSHLLKAYPVDAALSLSLEKAYRDIRPWEEEAYAAELSSALKAGHEAEAKLRVPIAVGGASSAAGFDLIFQGSDWGRLYGTGILGSVGKSFMSSGKGHGGGKIVLRGWDAVRNWEKEKTVKKQPSGTQDSPAVESELDYGSAFLSTLKQKLGGVAAASQDASQPDAPDPGLDKEVDASVTAEAMEGPRKKEVGAGGAPKHSEAVREDGEGVGEGVGEVDELVLVVHGIGQKLAGTYESFNFVHAVNSLRTACTTQSTSPSLAPLLHSKRAQFIPILWRAKLDFNAPEDSEAMAVEGLDNNFSLDDIEIRDSVPLLRQVVAGLVFDVPFYISPLHRDKMLQAVINDANRVYRLFCARNLVFAKNPKVSIIAHSLGSTLCADILSTQPCLVKPLAEMSLDEKRSQTEFVFDTRVLILVGSPLAFFLHLSHGQLIARAGRQRSKNVGPDIALDRPRYGCLAVDTLYNVYAQSDPVAFALNPTVDVKYAKMISPIAIPSTNTTLVQNLNETYNRVTRMLEAASLWASGDAKASEVVGAVEEQVHKAAAEAAEAAHEVKEKIPTGSKNDVKNASPHPGKSMKRMPSQMPNLPQEDFARIDRAERRFKALNPRGCLDYYLPSAGFNQYLEAISAHGSYWYDSRFATFTLLSLFSSEEDLERTGREELGTEV